MDCVDVRVRKEQIDTCVEQHEVSALERLFGLPTMGHIDFEDVSDSCRADFARLVCTKVERITRVAYFIRVCS